MLLPLSLRYGARIILKDFRSKMFFSGVQKEKTTLIYYLVLLREENVMSVCHSQE